MQELEAFSPLAGKGFFRDRTALLVCQFGGVLYCRRGDFMDAGLDDGSWWEDAPGFWIEIVKRRAFQPPCFTTK